MLVYDSLTFFLKNKSGWVADGHQAEPIAGEKTLYFHSLCAF